MHGDVPRARGGHTGRDAPTGSVPGGEADDVRWTRDELGVDHHTLRQALKDFSKKESLSQQRLPSVETECEGAGDVGYASIGSQASATGVCFFFPPLPFPPCRWRLSARAWMGGGGGVCVCVCV